MSVCRHGARWSVQGLRSYQKVVVAVAVIVFVAVVAAATE